MSAQRDAASQPTVTEVEGGLELSFDSDLSGPELRAWLGYLDKIPGVRYAESPTSRTITAVLDPGANRGIVRVWIGEFHWAPEEAPGQD